MRSETHRNQTSQQIPFSPSSSSGEGDFFLRTFSHLALPPLIMLLLFLIIGFGFFIPLLEQTFMDQKYTLCRRMVESTMTNLESRNQEYLEGKISLEEAQSRALSRIRNIRYGKDLKNYFWLVGEQDRFIMHPYRPDLEHQDPEKTEGPEGVPLSLLIARMRKAAEGQQGGFLEYEWQWKDASRDIEPKISYVQLFEPWNWIVGTGIYLREVEEELAAWKKRILWIGILLMGTASGVVLLLSWRSALLEKRERQAYRATRENEQKFRSIFDGAPYGISIHHLETSELIESNRAFRHILAMDEEELRGRNTMELGFVGDREELLFFRERLRREGFVKNISKTLVRPSGEERQILFSISLLQTEEEPLVLGIIIDVTEQHLLLKNNTDLQQQIQTRARDLNHLDTLLQKRQNMLEKVQRQLELINHTFEYISEGICLMDARRNIVSINPSFTAITGFTLEDLQGNHASMFRSDLEPPEFFATMDRELRENHAWEGEIWNRRKNGEAFPSYLVLTGLTDREGDIAHYIAVLEDRSELHASRKELEYETLHDRLTGLPNRTLFEDRLGVACTRAASQGKRIGVILLGLDRFDSINKSLGYHVGDHILRETALRMKAFLPEQETLARFANDEFILFIPSIGGTEEIKEIAENLLALIREPFTCEEHEIRCSATAGISIYPEDAQSPGDLVKNASLALGQAKKERRNWYQIFREDMGENVKYRHDVENALRKGISEEEFFMYYQPKLHAASGSLVGMEALMRWIRPGQGMIPPSTFIPLAEEIGEIVSLGRIALHTACEKTRNWNRELGQNLRVAVNVSTQQFADPSFGVSVLHALEEAQLDPAYLELEITESAFITDLPRAVRIMKELQKEGIRFSLDDFGTGYSSLSYIHHLPLSGIKIDQSLTFDLHLNASTRAVMSTLVFMARELHFELTVEGVENQEQLNFVRSLGEDIMVQGYFFSPPLAPEGFEQYLREYGKNI